MHPIPLLHHQEEKGKVIATGAKFWGTMSESVAKSWQDSLADQMYLKQTSRLQVHQALNRRFLLAV